MFSIAERMWIVPLIPKQIKPAVRKHTEAGYSGICGNQFKQFMRVLKSWVNWFSDKFSVPSLGSLTLSCVGMGYFLFFWSQTKGYTFYPPCKEFQPWVERVGVEDPTQKAQKNVMQWDSLQDLAATSYVLPRTHQGLIN